MFKKVALIIALLSLAGIIAWVGWMFWNREQIMADVEALPPRAAPPSPNAYDDYKAAAELAKEGKEDPSLEERRRLMAENEAALAKLRQGFSKEYREVPDPATATSLAYEGDFDYYSRLRTLARALLNESRVKAADGNLDGAVQSALDAIQLGTDLPRGAPMMGSLVGVAIESMGRSEVWPLVPSLDADTSKAAAQRLIRIAKNPASLRENLEEEIQRARDSLRYSLEHPDDYPQMVEEMAEAYREGEGEFANEGDGERTAGEPQTLKGTPFTRWMMNWGFIWSIHQGMLAEQRYLEQYLANNERPPVASELEEKDLADELYDISFPVYQKAWAKMTNNHTQNLLLATTLALHAYQKEQGAYPQSLNGLVPAYLPEVPQDPFLPNTELQYVHSGEKYLLYSVGPDGKDDGGKPIDHYPDTVKNPNTKGRYAVDWESKGDIVAGVNH